MDIIKTEFDKELEEKPVNKPRAFLVWKVGETEYKLKLTTSAITTLESQLNKPLMDAVLDNGIPEQNVIVSLLQGAMQKFQHGLKSTDISYIIDDYIDEGHTLMDLLKEVIYPLMYDAGFFTKAMLESMLKAVDDLDTQL